MFFFYDTFIIFDHLKQEVTLAAIDLFEEGRSLTMMESAIDEMEAQLYAGTTFGDMELGALKFQPMLPKEQFVAMVDRAKQHIMKGDIFQIVLSQRFSSPYTGDPFALYRQLRTSNPSPYMFYMDYGAYIILGTSPESLVKVKNRKVTTNPIAGTKPRGKTVEQDEAIAQNLLNDEKEIAEHRMLVDLGRNDIGRISKVGSVKLAKYMNIERYKYVMHIVSEVVGELRDDVHVLDVLSACLPAGTVSGAPKIRAMQLINEMEPVKRGVYAGAVGYISSTGAMDLALAIRTMIIKDDRAHVQAGAGIVYDSIPLSEYEETLNKARALLEVKKMILLIDNYDSFTYNLYQQVSMLGKEVKVVRNDELTIEEIKDLQPQGIILSPGPGTPDQAGITVDVVKELYTEFPILGICLGHQSIGQAFGGNIVQAKKYYAWKIV